jgi:hypothetical protein
MFLQKPSGVDRVTCLCQGVCDGHGEALATQSRSDEVISHLSRRHVLRTTIAGTAAGVLTSAGIEFSSPRQALAQSTLSPEAALQALMDGNRRFVERRLTFYKEDLAILQQNTGRSRSPSPLSFPAPIPVCQSNSCSTRASGMCSSTEWLATSQLRKSLPVSNMVSQCSGRGYSWCWATRPAERSKLRSRPRRCRGRSARFIAISVQRSTRLAAT